MYKAHRLAWAFVHGGFPDQHIDHINGDPSDNRLCNLRVADRSLNMQNQRHARSDSATGLLGVSKNGSGWRAEIRVDGKKINKMPHVRGSINGMAVQLQYALRERLGEKT
jgi:hypothetical protein